MRAKPNVAPTVTNETEIVNQQDHPTASKSKDREQVVGIHHHMYPPQTNDHETSHPERFSHLSNTQEHNIRGDVPNQELINMILKLSEQVDKLSNNKSSDSHSKVKEECVSEAELMKRQELRSRIAEFEHYGIEVTPGLNVNSDKTSSRNLEMEHWRMKAELDEREASNNFESYLMFASHGLETSCNLLGVTRFKTTSLGKSVEKAFKDGRFRSCMHYYNQTLQSNQFMSNPLYNFVSTFASVTLKNHLQSTVASVQANKYSPKKQRHKNGGSVRPEQTSKPDNLPTISENVRGYAYQNKTRTLLDSGSVDNSSSTQVHYTFEQNPRASRSKSFAPTDAFPTNPKENSKLPELAKFESVSTSETDVATISMFPEDGSIERELIIPDQLSDNCQPENSFVSDAFASGIVQSALRVMIPHRPLPSLSRPLQTDLPPLME